MCDQCVLDTAKFTSAGKINTLNIFVCRTRYESFITANSDMTADNIKMFDIYSVSAMLVAGDFMESL
jgi:hypothetical protein